MLSDCHVHLASYDPWEVSEIVHRATDLEVGLIITAGTTLASSQAGVDLAQIYSSVYAGIGIHPLRLCNPLGEDTYESLLRLARSSPKVVAISETGMDYLPNAPDRTWQEQAFRRHIQLAYRLRLPVIWHSQVSEAGITDAHTETLRILREEGAGTVGGVMHYFQADEATAWNAIESGFLISFAKPLLRLPHLWDLARKIPLQHIVLETDASPQPWRARREEWTEPRDIPQIAQKLAHLKGLPLEEVAEATTANLTKLLRISP